MLHHFIASSVSAIVSAGSVHLARSLVHIEPATNLSKALSIWWSALASLNHCLTVAILLLVRTHVALRAGLLHKVIFIVNTISICQTCLQGKSLAGFYLGSVSSISILVGTDSLHLTGCLVEGIYAGRGLRARHHSEACTFLDSAVVTSVLVPMSADIWNFAWGLVEAVGATCCRDTSSIGIAALDCCTLLHFGLVGAVFGQVGAAVSRRSWRHIVVVHTSSLGGTDCCGICSTGLNYCSAAAPCRPMCAGARDKGGWLIVIIRALLVSGVACCHREPGTEGNDTSITIVLWFVGARVKSG